MLACLVCQMVLGSPGTCPLCGSEVRDAAEVVHHTENSSQSEADSVGLPFGLGEDLSIPPTTILPFGIEEAPDTPTEASEGPTKAASILEDQGLPFGIEDAPITPPNPAPMPGAESTSTTLPFGIEDSPSESPPETENLPSNESRIPTSELPFGIEHMHHTPIE